MNTSKAEPMSPTEVRLQDGHHQLRDGDLGVRIAAVGDLMLGAGVGEAIKGIGPTHPLRAVRPLLAEADIRFANLEWPLTNTERRHPVIRHRARRAPREAIDSIEHAGFTVVSVANNHIFDCLDEGLADSLALLHEKGIGWVGGGANLSSARTPAIQTANGIRVGFLAYTFPLHQIATDMIPGCAPNDPGMMLDDVRRLKSVVDHVILSMHTGPDAGNEFCFYPSVSRQGLCRRLIDAGATAILCHHCHVPQGIEVYSGGLIAHGLGSFITDIHDWFFQSAKPPYSDFIDKAMIVQLELDRSRLLSFKVHPTMTGADLAVRPLSGKERAAYLEWLQDVSSVLYQTTALESRLPARHLGAKLARLKDKALRNGALSLARELAADALGAFDARILEPRRLGALERDLRASSCQFVKTGIPVEVAGKLTGDR